MSFGDELRKALDSELIEPPKGPYKVTLDEGSAFHGKKDQELCKLTFKIIDGDHAGQRFETWLRFASPKAKEMSVEALAALGVRIADVETLQDIDDQLGELLVEGVEADVSVSYGGDEGQFLNVKVHGSRTGKSDIPTTNGDEPKDSARSSFSAAAGAKTDDTIPF